MSDELGACLRIPGITAHCAVFADGLVTDKTVVVHGLLGAVGSLAAQLARWGGATVIGTVTRHRDLDLVNPAVADQPDPIDASRANAPEGVHLIIEVPFSDNADLPQPSPPTTPSSPPTQPAATATRSRSGQC